MQLSDFRCRARLRVRWAEVDMQRIVFNAHYLMYIDTAMMDYWRALALPYEASMEHLGGELYVKKATLEYNASALEGDTLTVGLARELAAHNVRVNGVRPGLVDTEIHASGGIPDRAHRLGKDTPLGRAGQPEEVAAAILWLCSPGASYTTGAILDVGGGR